MPHISHFEAQILARSRDILSDMAQHQLLVCEIDILSRFDQADVEIRSTLDILLNIAGPRVPSSKRPKPDF